MNNLVVTQKNDLEATLKWLSQMYREAPIGLCFLDRELRYVFINEWLAQINGTGVEGHLGRTVSEVLPEIAAGVESQLRHVLETGEPVLEGIVEAKTPAAPGQKRVFQHNYYAVMAEDGTVVGVSCAVQDVTERRRAEESARLAARIIDHMAEGVQLTRTDTREIVFANPRFERMFGYGSGELNGKPVTVLNASGEKSPEETAAEIIRILNRTGTWSGEIRNVKKDGTIFWCHAVVSTFHHCDYGTVWVSVHQDITERKAAEQQARRHQEDLSYASRINTLGELATGIAHELNQPLTAIANYSAAMKTLLESPAANANQLREIAGCLVEQAVRSCDIFRRLRSFVSRSNPTQIPTDLNSLIRDVARFLDLNISSNQIVMEFCLAEPSPIVAVDPIQIQQVLVNLIRNAIDAMQETPRCDRVVTVSTATCSDERIEVAVSDWGTGLTKDEVERVFDPFFSTKPQGMGMGLGISRSIIENHGGRLWAQPNDGPGVTFRFTVPAERPKWQIAPATTDAYSLSTTIRRSETPLVS